LEYNDLCHGRLNGIVYGRINCRYDEIFGKVKLFPVAITSKAGIPHVVPITFLIQTDDDTIWLADDFMKKTFPGKKKLTAICCMTRTSAIVSRLTGQSDVLTSGQDYENIKEGPQKETNVFLQNHSGDEGYPGIFLGIRPESWKKVC